MTFNLQARFAHADDVGMISLLFSAEEARYGHAFASTTDVDGWKKAW